MSTERRRENYHRWYRKHQGEYLAGLRERRRNDPDYREREVKRAADFRAKIKAGYKPNVTPLHIEIDGEQVRGYRQSECSREANCTPRAITNWIEAGLIPEPHLKDGQRLFTQSQVELVALFSSIHPYDQEARNKAAMLIHEQWWSENLTNQTTARLGGETIGF